MEAFTTHTGLLAAIDRANIDTDAIIPKQYLKSIKRSGFGVTLFDDWRYLDAGEPGMDHSTRAINPEFTLNATRYQGASILIARDNFGCGSSREHAVWALADYGFRVVISPSFADIFFNNSFNNGLLPIVLDEASVAQIFDECAANEGYKITVDLEAQQVATPNGDTFAFEIDAFRKHRLLNGLDDIGLSLQHRDEITAFEQNRQADKPWLFTL